MRPSRQAGELSGGGESIGDDMGFESADCVSSISAEGMGRRRGAANQDGGSRRDRISNQARDSTGSDSCCRGGRFGSRRGSADAAYGINTEFREGVTALGLQ